MATVIPIGKPAKDAERPAIAEPRDTLARGLPVFPLS